MPDSADESRSLRARQRVVQETIDRHARDRPQGGSAYVGRVFAQATLPTVVPAVYMTHPLAVSLASETEGSAATRSADTTAVVPVVVLGPKPAVGDDLIAKLVQGYWVSQGRTAPPTTPIVPFPNCLCPGAPATLTMDVNNPTLNGGMFQDCTLHYGPTPPEYAALNLGTSCWLSTDSFVDSNGDTFRYHFACNFNLYQLSRAYATSPFGSPFLDGPRFRWGFGVTGNTCSPFLLSNGTIYSGGDPAVRITITPAV